jgi:CHAT domain-containing protein
MEQFYKNLAKGTPESALTKAEALRQAQLVILRGEDTDDTADSQIPSSVPPVEVNTDSPSLDQQGESISPVSKKFFRHPYYWSAFILMGQGL